MFTITTKLQTVNGKEYSLPAVNNMTRDELNNKLHYLGDQILKLRMQEAMLVDMRNSLDTLLDELDIYDAMSGSEK
jgi:prefoldin subunit 5